MRAVLAAASESSSGHTGCPAPPQVTKQRYWMFTFVPVNSTASYGLPNQHASASGTSVPMPSWRVGPNTEHHAPSWEP